MHYSFKNLLLYSQLEIIQTMYIVYSIDDQGRVYQNCKFHDPGAGVLMLGRVHISHYSEYAVSTVSIYSTLIAIMLRDYDAVFLYHRWFSFILWWSCWYTNSSPSEVSVKSVLLRWPLRPVGLLLIGKEPFQHLSHSLDIWHKEKKLAFLLGEKAKKAANKDLLPWIGQLWTILGIVEVFRREAQRSCWKVDVE